MLPRRPLFERLEARALLAVYTVDSAGLPHPSDGLTSFHEAIAAANITAEADVIEFSPTLAGSTILLGSPLTGGTPTVGSDLTIRGLGSGQLTFTPSHQHFGGFLLTSGVSHFAISGVTFVPSTAPGAPQLVTLVQNSTGQLRLQDVVANGLTGDGVVANGGSVTLVDTVLTGVATTPNGANGWGVNGSQNSQSVQLLRSEVSRFGRGGIRAAGDISIVDSTISDNNIAAQTNGSGLRSTNGQIEVVRSTVSRNYSLDGTIGGGGVSARWGVSIVDSTVSNNAAFDSGGGVYTQDGPMSILRSVIRDNRSLLSSQGGGGAYKGGNAGMVVIAESTFEGNQTEAHSANGGGLFSLGEIAISDSTFTDNHTLGSLSAGGGVYAPRGGSISRSLFEDNSVAVHDSDGGAVWVGALLTVDASTFRNNSTNGVECDGGAIHIGPGVISNSTFVGNRTLGPHSDGGAIAFLGGGPGLTILNTTITGNATVREWSDGGGVYHSEAGNLNVQFSTIAGNRVEHNLSRGGGFALGDPSESGVGSGVVTFSHSILGDNAAVGGNPDLYIKTNIYSQTSNVASDYSLIENTSGLTAPQLAAINAGSGNLLGVDAMLAPLADNGGRTHTMGPLPGSPAIDAGDPSVTAGAPNVPAYDQRGLPYLRIAGGRADLGALEAQPTPPYADFDDDFDVDGADFLAWQRGLGTASGATPAQGDADADGDVDATDLGTWKSQFALSALPASALTGLAANTSTAVAQTRAAHDAVYAGGDLSALFDPPEELRPIGHPRWRRGR
jgi:hypothetical protein